jgi:hypothetical protein
VKGGLSNRVAMSRAGRSPRLGAIAGRVLRVSRRAGLTRHPAMRFGRRLIEANHVAIGQAENRRVGRTKHRAMHFVPRLNEANHAAIGRAENRRGGRIRHRAMRFVQHEAPIPAALPAIEVRALHSVVIEARARQAAILNAARSNREAKTRGVLPAIVVRALHSVRIEVRVHQAAILNAVRSNREAKTPGVLPAIVVRALHSVLIEVRVRQAATLNAVRSNREAKTPGVLPAIEVRALPSVLIEARVHQAAILNAVHSNREAKTPVALPAIEARVRPLTATAAPPPRAITRRGLPASAFRALHSAKIPHHAARETTHTMVARAASVRPATPNAASSTHLARAIQVRHAAIVVRVRRAELATAMTANVRRATARSKNAALRNVSAMTVKLLPSPPTRPRQSHRNPRNHTTTPRPHPPASLAREKKASFACRRSCPNSGFARAGKPMNGSRKAGYWSMAR